MGRWYHWTYRNPWCSWTWTRACNQEAFGYTHTGIWGFFHLGRFRERIRCLPNVNTVEILLLNAYVLVCIMRLLSNPKGRWPKCSKFTQRIMRTASTYVHSIDIAKCSYLFLKRASNNTGKVIVTDPIHFVSTSHAYYNRPRLHARYLSQKSRDIPHGHGGRVTFEQAACRDADKTTFNTNSHISAHNNIWAYAKCYWRWSFTNWCRCRLCRMELLGRGQWFRIHKRWFA